MEQYAREEIYPDGSFAECSPNYGLGCLHRLQDLVSQATERKLAIPPIMTQRMARAVRYFAFTSDPLGRSARIAKGGEDVRRQLGLINSMVEDPAVHFVVSGGEEGELPPSCVSYSWAGHHAMRSGWDADATWLFFDSGPRGSGHHDMAQNGIQLISGRRWLLADSGYYSYSASGPDGEMARYLKSSAAHNTALVNGECQLPFAPGSRLRPNTEEGDFRWYQDEDTASAEGTYVDGYSADGEIDVRHRLQLLSTSISRWWILLLRMVPFDSSPGPSVPMRRCHLSRRSRNGCGQTICVHRPILRLFGMCVAGTEGPRTIRAK